MFILNTILVVFTQSPDLYVDSMLTIILTVLNKPSLLLSIDHTFSCAVRMRLDLSKGKKVFGNLSKSFLVKRGAGLESWIKALSQPHLLTVQSNAHYKAFLTDDKDKQPSTALAQISP